MPEAKARTARELVLEKYPTAFIHDDGESVKVCVGETEVLKCKYGYEHTRNKTPDFCPVLSNMGNADAAWKAAAENLRLL